MRLLWPIVEGSLLVPNCSGIPVLIGVLILERRFSSSPRGFGAGRLRMSMSESTVPQCR